MTTPREAHLEERLEAINQEVYDLRSELEEQTKTILFLARLLGKTLGQRDRARDLAVTLEQELAVLRVDA